MIGKKNYIREAIAALNPNHYRQVTIGKCQEWLIAKYGADAKISSTAFYVTRKEMSQPLPMAVAPTLAKKTNGVVTFLESKDGIVALVRQLKQVIAKIGKDEAKELIDILC